MPASPPASALRFRLGCDALPLGAGLLSSMSFWGVDGPLGILRASCKMAISLVYAAAAAIQVWSASLACGRVRCGPRVSCNKWNGGSGRKVRSQAVFQFHWSMAACSPATRVIATRAWADFHSPAAIRSEISARANMKCTATLALWNGTCLMRYPFMLTDPKGNSKVDAPCCCCWQLRRTR